MNTKFSIITISFNSASTIERTILSVISQGYHNLEYIIIDGGSTDNTIDIIQKYSENITYWVSEPDKGIYDAMNKGVRKATGDIIGILNSDDWYEDDTLYQISQAYANSDKHSIFHGNMAFHKHNEMKIYYPILNLTYFYKGTILLHPTMFVPKVVYDALSFFDIQYKIAADYDFMLRAYKKRVHFEYMNRVLTNMSAGGESDIKKIAGYRETFLIACRQGYPILKVTYSFVLKSVLAIGVYIKDKIFFHE